ncbi:5-methyltetrahydropteroyltriglutamate--homocysteine S-methyltransferase [Micrococcales bacterium 31B]|nr:5-methyltetrahydropteroyltriglutamate--homocysteine S-methyltransferase [Micrococcales bacterium 31B]
MTTTHVLGFPRIGARRELKKAVEAYWGGKADRDALLATAADLRAAHWATQKNAGLSFVATGDFSFYDQVLDTSLALGVVPQRFRGIDYASAEDLYFAIARGDVERNIPAAELTKWFDTNYHFLVPEFDGDAIIATTAPAEVKVVAETREAAAAGFTPKPVVLGPITYLALAKGLDGATPWQYLEAVTARYEAIIAELAQTAEWIQIDEPILATELSDEARAAFAPTIERLVAAAGSAKVLVATYFGSLKENLALLEDAPVAGFHVDLTRGDDTTDALLAAAGDSKVLSLGIVDGRNVWVNDYATSLETLRAFDALGERRWVASSSSLQHAPVDAEIERTENTTIDPLFATWLSFAVQKCTEVATLARALDGTDLSAELSANAEVVASRANHRNVVRPEVREKVAAYTEADGTRDSAYAARREAQAWLNLPLLPTTTIGSYPQTREIREARKRYRTGEITEAEYIEFIKAEIKFVIEKQETLGLDVLVHGESERNDMVEYFGQNLDGFLFTTNGWVQSYGSRCVKPPVVYGDVSRPAPITVEWSTYAQSLTEKPVKGMLTGPVTILCWSFIRDDLTRAEVTQQIAAAIRDEVLDLETAGIGIIQIDEAALSEGLPLRRSEHAEYLRWAVDAFRLASGGVADRTQIHTHMCYSEFNDIIDAILRLDADAISVESSRSRGELLEAFESFNYTNSIGPGVWDIHSPRVPTQDEIEGLLALSLERLPAERLWVNPDCGLKTRAWPETEASIVNLVAAAATARAKAASLDAGASGNNASIAGTVTGSARVGGTVKAGA